MAIAVGAFSRKAQAPLAMAVDKVGVVRRAVAPARRSDNILVRLYQDMAENRLLAVAAGLAFYALLALVPSLAAVVSLFGLVADPAKLATSTAQLTTFMPADAAALAQKEALRLASQSTQTLSIKLAVALFLSLWSGSTAVRACFDALNVIDEQREGRTLIRLYATSLGVTLSGILVILLAIVVISANPGFVALGPVSEQTVWIYGLLRWPLFFCFAVVAITMLYWIGPSRPPSGFSRLLPGAAIAALFWAIGSSVFGWYVATLGNYTATYGSLATVVVMMTWLWLSAAIVLLGAQINYELAHKP